MAATIAPVYPQLYLSPAVISQLQALSDTLSVSLRDLVEEIAALEYVPSADAEMKQALNRGHRRAKLQVTLSPQAHIRLSNLSEDGTPAAGLEAIVRELVVPVDKQKLEVALKHEIGDDPLVELRTVAALAEDTATVPYKLWLSSKSVRNLKALVLEMDDWRSPKRTFAGVLDYLTDPQVSFRYEHESYPWNRHPRLVIVHPRIALRFAQVALTEGMAAPANRRDGPLFAHAVEAIGQGALIVLRGDATFNAGRGPRMDAQP